jgi:serpin B
VWGEQTYAWQPSFLDLLAKSYGTGVYQTDFIHGSEAARQQINDWVANATADKIQNLLPAGSLDGSTRMVLVDAVHLKLPWQSPFNVNMTASSSFTKGDGTTVHTDFMNAVDGYPYLDDGAAQIVALPLAGGALSVVIALPHGDLAAYENGLTATSVALARPATSSLVQLSLPKLTFTSPSFSLKEPLKAMGMTDAFNASVADFSGMHAPTGPGDGLSIDNVFHKAMLAMAEGGVEAAAATAVVMTDASVELDAGPPIPPIPMIVDRPYLVSIVDTKTGALLFVGHVQDPTDQGS